MSEACTPRSPSLSQPAGGSAVEERRRMVEEQLKAPSRNITDPRVLAAMLTVPRHLFLPEDARNDAYGDYPVKIGCGQTISQPYIVAFMTQALNPQPDQRILEIGTGSGYQAAILGQLAKEVYTIEIVEPLAATARTVLESQGCRNVHVRHGDGFAGWPEAAPFDAIIVTCAPENVPEPLTRQLREGGRLVIPVGAAGDQKLVLIQKRGGTLHRTGLLSVRFVPMTGKAGD